MNNETAEQIPEVLLPEKIKTELQKENITDKVIAELQKHKELTINGIDDKLGYKAVDEARKECKKIRVLAVKICKKGREAAVLEQKAWIAEENRVESQISEIEGELLEKQNVIDAEIERIRLEEETKETMRVQAMIDQLNKYGVAVDYYRLKAMSAEEFDEEIVMHKTAWEKAEAEKAEINRLAKLKESRIADLATVGFVYTGEECIEALTFDAYEAIFTAAIEAKEAKEKAEAEQVLALQKQKEEQDKKDAELKEKELLMNLRNTRVELMLSYGYSQQMTDALIYQMGRLRVPCDIGTINDEEWGVFIDVVEKEKKKHDEANAAQAKALKEQEEAASRKQAEAEKAKADAEELALKTLIQPFIEMGFTSFNMKTLHFKEITINIDNIQAMNYKELAQFQGDVLNIIADIESAELKQTQAEFQVLPETQAAINVNTGGELVKEVERIDDIEFLSEFFGEDEMRQLSDNWSKKIELVVRVKE